MDLNALITRKETLVSHDVVSHNVVFNDLASNDLVSHDFDTPIHIAICFDTHYAMPAGVLISSILETNSDKHFSIHLFALSIDERDIEKFKQFQNKKLTLTLYYVNDNFTINPDTLVVSHVSVASCLRLFIADYLSDMTDRLLYLDCDMVCHGDLAAMVNQDISHHVAAVVADAESMQKKQCKVYDLPYGGYFNSGMLYINIKQWKALNITQQALNTINDGHVYQYGDQDVLNLLLSGKVKYLSHTCNQLVSQREIERMIKKNSIHEGIILHYAGTKKPWVVIYMDAIYQQHFNASPWRAVELKMFEQKRPSSLKGYSLYGYKNRHYFLAIKYGVLFLLNKLHLINSFKNK